MLTKLVASCSCLHLFKGKLPSQYEVWSTELYKKSTILWGSPLVPALQKQEQGDGITPPQYTEWVRTKVLAAGPMPSPQSISN